MATKKIEGTTEAWESGRLGGDAAHAQISSLDSSTVDDAMDLQMISIRLQKTLLSDLKAIAKRNGIGYQPLMKQVLKRFVDSEIRMMLNECVYEHMREEGMAALKEREPKKKEHKLLKQA